MLFIPGSGLHSALANVPRNFRCLASIPNSTAWRLGVVASVVRRMNEVTLRRARLVLGWVTVWAGIPSRYVTSQLGQLSLASLRGR